MRKWIVLAIMLAILAGCRPGQDDAPKARKKGKVGISVLTMTNPFFKEIADVFSAEMEKAGYEVIVVDPDKDVVKQYNQVQDFLEKKVSAIVLCPCKTFDVGAAIRLANDKGVPVFTADLTCIDPKAKIVTHVATDNLAGGKLAGEAMIEALGPGGGKILVLEFKDAESCLKRVEGFDDVIRAHNQKNPNGQITTVMQLGSGGDKEISNKATLDALQKHRDLAGIFAINDPAALGARAAVETDLKDKADQVKIIGFDGFTEGKKAILDGKIYADPIQYPDQIARKTAESILRYFAGEQVPREILIPTTLYRKADALKDPLFKK